MKRVKFALLFCVLCVVSILVVEHVAFGILGKTCHCVDHSVIRDECEMACYIHEGCDDPMINGTGWCFNIDSCCHPVNNICKNEEFVFGYHVDFNCNDCYGLPVKPDLTPGKSKK